jgi:putative ABC transport system permease protein
VVREGVMLIMGGYLLGAVGTLAVRRSLESQLFGVRSADPVVLALSMLTLAAVAIVACALPARRATRIDPVIALAE